jgi:alpha-L-rhamnosidase
MSLVTLAFEGNGPAHLQCEGMQEPLGIDIPHPRLSWQLQDSRRGARQAAYEIRVASSAEGLAGPGHVWDSGRPFHHPVFPYGGPAVESPPHWQVRV